MQDFTSLHTLTKKLEEIKESWQIYAIFEEARKEFNEEFAQLQKDKESLIESFNATSAKNALLNAQNKELEEKNRELQESINATTKQSDSTHSRIQDSLNAEQLHERCAKLQEILHSIQTIIKDSPKAALKPLQKLEVSYQKHQRLLANPAKEYVEFHSAKILSNALEEIESQCKLLENELLKLLQILMIEATENKEN